MEIFKLSDTIIKPNYKNDTTRIYFKDIRDTIFTDKEYFNTYTSIFTNSNTFVIQDNDLVALHELQSNEIIFSHFLFNLEKNTLTDLLSLRLSTLKNEVITEKNHSDSFVKVFNNEIKNKTVSIISYLGLDVTGKKIIAADGSPIVEVKDNKLIRINFTKAKEIPTSFLYLDKDLEEANFPNALKISDTAFFNNKNMKILNVPKAKYIGNFVLYNNKIMEKIYLPSATYIGSEFLSKNENKKIHISNKLENFNNILFKIQNKER
ncbi:MAG: hypothetical protein ACI4N3_00725 [Alphaproteobacteria bacterium]